MTVTNSIRPSPQEDGRGTVTNKSHRSLSTCRHLSLWRPQQPSSSWGLTPSLSCVVSMGRYCRNPLSSWSLKPGAPSSLSHTLGADRDTAWATAGGKVRSEGSHAGGSRSIFMTGAGGHALGFLPNPNVGLQHSANPRSPQVHPINSLCKCEIKTPVPRWCDQQRCHRQQTRSGPCCTKGGEQDRMYTRNEPGICLTCF